jgi:nucleobase:cation symporter-1, NCS1 family
MEEGPMALKDASATARRPLIEEHSYDYVPVTERHGETRSLFFVWFGASAHVLTVVAGAIAISLGLNFWWALVAILVGNLLGAVFMALHSAQGPRLGLPQVIQSRAQFGYYGALLVLVLVWAMYIGFAAYDILLAGQGFQQILGGNLTLWMIAMTAALLLLAVFGYDWIHLFMKYQTWAYVPIFVLVAVVLVVHGLPVAALNHGGFSLSNLLLATSVIAVYQISYAPYVSDYSRYLAPEKASGTFWNTYWGTSIVSVGLMTLGAAIATLAPTAQTLSEIKVIGGNTLGSILVVVLAFGLLPPSAMNIYGGILSTLTIGNNFAKFRSTVPLRIVIGAGVAVIALLVATAGAGNFMNSFLGYLTWLLYFLVPWTAINLTDYYLVRRGKYRTEDFFNPGGPFGSFAWRGLFVYFLTFAVEIPFMNSTISGGPWQGPISKAMGGADIAWIVGLAVAIPLYYFVARGANRPALDEQDAAKWLEPAGTPRS